MAGIFDPILGVATSNLVLLNICHTTKDSIENHKNIIGKQRLSVSDCPVYKEPLLYLFYGRPAYKVPAPHYPMCFIFQLDDADVNNIRRKMAFDSGAFYSKRMEKYFPGTTAKLEDFEIANVPMEYLPRFIKLFFDTNANYYDSKVHDPLPEYSEDLVNRYIAMIKSTDDSDLDDRRKSLEIQFSSDIDMSIKRPEMLIISSAYIENDDEKTILEELSGCSIEIYEQSKSCDFHMEINVLVRSYFGQKAVL